MSATSRALLLLLLAAPAAAQDYNVEGRPRTAAAITWSAVGTLGTSNDTTSDTTHNLTTSAQLDINNIGVCLIAKDESGAGTTDGNGNAQFTSITDSAGNTWTEAYEWCNMQTSTASNGSCVGLYYTKATANLASAGTITPTYTTATSKAMTCFEFSTSASATITEAAGENGLANDAADPGSMTIATGQARQHLFIRASSCESNSTAFTADTDYTAFSNATANTGTSSTSHGIRGEYRIATESTSAASDPSYAAADCASAMIALDAT